MHERSSANSNIYKIKHMKLLCFHLHYENNTLYI